MCGSGPSPLPRGPAGSILLREEARAQSPAPLRRLVAMCRILPVPGLGVHVMERLTIFPKVKILVCSGKDFGGY